MKGWLLDTNVISETRSERPNRNLRKWLDSHPQDSFFLSILTIAEFEKGIGNLPLSHTRRPVLRNDLAALEDRYRGRVLPVSDAIVRRWGAISGEVKRLTGHSPVVVDTMLAATALEIGLYLATRNTRDVMHSGALLFNPWKDDPALFPLTGYPDW